MCVLVEAKSYIAVVDQGGTPGISPPPPPGPNSFIFAYVSLKSIHTAPSKHTQQCWHPLMRNPGSATVKDMI